MRVNSVLTTSLLVVQSRRVTIQLRHTITSNHFGRVIMSNSISEILLNIGAVKINTEEKFTWASGIKSPIYCDNRKTIGFPEKRAQIVEAFVESIKENFSDVEVIA